MNFIKKLSGKESKKESNCCGVEIKEVEKKQEDSCCGTGGNDSSCC